MPSFSNKKFLKIQLIYLIADSLQVPCKFPLNYEKNALFREKRVLPFTSFWKARVSAGMTVEAALCLPLFLFFAAALMEPMRWLDRQRKAQAVMEHFSGELGQYVYMKETGEGSQGNADEDLDEGKNENYSELVSDAAAGLWLSGRLRDCADGAVIKLARVPDSSGDVRFEAEYREKIPFFKIGNGGVRMHAASRRRSWIGLDGKLKGKNGGNGETLTEGEMVYVGASRGKYHLYRDCHYISNEYETVSLNEAEHRRNSSGERYKACSRCARGGSSGKTVYITYAGEHYHFSKSCSAMASYVQSVPLSEVEHLGVCSYCARKSENGG